MDYFLDLVRGLGLDEYRENLRELARPSIEILPTTATAHATRSRFGGHPDLPKTFTWPGHSSGPYRFIGQVDLRDLPPNSDCLPPAGLLSFFYAHDEEGEAFWGDDHYVRTFLFGEDDELEPVEPPAPVRIGAMRVVRFQMGLDLPPWPWLPGRRSQWPIPERLWEAYDELRLRLHPSWGYLLGFPLNSTLAYDPTPGLAWQSLLTLSSDDDMAWSWHDGDWLVTFIELERLRAADFSIIKSDAG